MTKVIVEPVAPPESLATARRPEEIEALIAQFERNRQIVAQSLRGPTDATRMLRAIRDGEDDADESPKW